MAHDWPMKTTRLALVMSMLFLSSCPKMGEMLRSFGYTELRPPSQLMMPGTMVWVEKTKPFKAGIICTQAMSLGKDFKPINSPTSNSTLNRASNVKVDIGADLLNLVQGKAAMSAIHSVKVELANPVIYTLSDMDVLNAIPHRDPVCSQAILGRLRAGFPVTMIGRALMADVIYSVQWKQGIELDVRARIEALSGLAPHLGVSEGNIRENTITGKNLFWGVMDDVYLSKLALNGNVGPTANNPHGLPPVRDSDEAERIIGVEESPVLADTVDTDAFSDDDEE
jgi:hypothetical protein